MSKEKIKYEESKCKSLISESDSDNESFSDNHQTNFKFDDFRPITRSYKQRTFEKSSDSEAKHPDQKIQSEISSDSEEMSDSLDNQPITPGKIVISG